MKNRYIEMLENGLYEAERGRVLNNSRALNMPSFAGLRLKHLVNYFCNQPEVKTFLDVGAFRGAITVNALLTNDTKAYTIDHYKYNPYEGNPLEQDGWANLRQGLKDNMKLFGIADRVVPIESVASEVDIKNIIDLVDVCYFDISADDTFNAMTNLSETFNEFCILISPNLSEENIMIDIERALNSVDYNILKFDNKKSKGTQDAKGWWNGTRTWLLYKEGKSKVNKEDIIKKINEKTVERRKEDKKVTKERRTDAKKVSN